MTWMTILFIGLETGRLAARLIAGGCLVPYRARVIAGGLGSKKLAWFDFFLGAERHLFSDRDLGRSPLLERLIDLVDISRATTVLQHHIVPTI